MLNTGLHVASKKLKKANTAAMTLEEYISNTRLGVGWKIVVSLGMLLRCLPISLRTHRSSISTRGRIRMAVLPARNAPEERPRRSFQSLR